MQESKFLWTMPCYILASNYTMSPDNGDVILDEDIRFVTPERTPGGEVAIAVFTDSHLAEEFRDASTASDRLELLEFSRPESLMRFLVAAQRQYRLLVVDLNRKNRLGLDFVIQEFLPQLQEWIDGQENHGDQSI